VRKLESERVSALPTLLCPDPVVSDDEESV